MKPMKLTKKESPARASVCRRDGAEIANYFQQVLTPLFFVYNFKTIIS